MQAEVSRKDKMAALGEDIEQVDWDLFVVKGTMQELEKSYFRLTSAPDPSTVRPESVLRRAYERLIHLLRQGKQNYFYALDQFKGMRQDCTVQHLRNDLTVGLCLMLTLTSCHGSPDSPASAGEKASCTSRGSTLQHAEQPVLCSLLTLKAGSWM